MRKSNLESRISGFSLVELMIGVAILLVGVTPLLFVILGTHDRIVSRQGQSKAVTYARNLLETINTLRWDEDVNSATNYIGSPSPTLGLDSDDGETNISQADDIDDYHTYSTSPVQGVSLTVGVYYANVIEDTQLSTTTSITDYKLIKVTGVAESGKGNFVEVVQSIRANGVF